MNKDSRLSSVLHVLLHMAHSERPLTSDELASYLHTNAVVVRRTLAGLRDLGYVAAGKGHGGGWTLAVDLHRLSLRDVYAALGEPALFALGHRSDNPSCLVEQAVIHAIDAAVAEAEALLLQRLGEVTLADLATEFNRRAEALGYDKRKTKNAH
ncbi:DNA-binding IscR family transcriptional regulator [Tahibacter aquaticus]|uniref:DNA-binding IscR family transcriptional regulator n=2 Tax=Tahibacter aquaticus TaxID=520092 RepID=A0A4R6YWC1_9GAMM|nr:Rrf2 family transcriptional regulator [Tahibacter aquaticus]TDR43126.1 DNA-binding IscR family transcriptional regulator [Tahibacter aquaticus]